MKKIKFFLITGLLILMGCTKPQTLEDIVPNNKFRMVSIENEIINIGLNFYNDKIVGIKYGDNKEVTFKYEIADNRILIDDNSGKLQFT